MDHVQLTFPGIGSSVLKIKFMDTMAEAAYHAEHHNHHDEYEFYLHLSGDVSFEVENRIYPLSRGSVLLVRPYEYHHCIVQSPTQHTYYWMLLQANAHEPWIREVFLHQDHPRVVAQLSEKALLEAEAHLTALYHPKLSFLDRQLHFWTFLRMLSDSDIQPPELPSALTPVAAAALTYMDEHLSDPLDMEQLARYCHVSVNTLERHFQKGLQASPSAVLRKKRLVHSSQLLRDGLSVSEACDQSGFTDYSSYIATFRKFFGLTPLQYQKKSLRSDL